MAGYALEMIEQLARQLLMSPPRLRIQQMHGAEYLVNLIEPERAYPYELVLYHVTHFRRPRPQETEPPLAGESLIADLVRLVDELSGSVDLPADRLGQACSTIEQFGKRFRISPKTISRWRPRGLVAYRALCDDGRRRTVFPERSIRRFVGKHASLIKRASNFSTLTDAEHQAVIDKARELVDGGATRVGEVAERVAGMLGRSTETVRYVLRRHDQEHRENRLFDREPRPLGREEHLQIYRCYRSGDTVPDLARRFGRRTSNIYRIITEIRAKELLRRHIEYVPSEEFDEPDADALILGNGRVPAKTRKGGRKSKPPSEDLPAYLKALYDLPLLRGEQERDLFRRYNYLKFKAARLAGSIDPHRPRSRDLNELESWLDRADEIKNDLIEANLRLVVNIAKKHVRHGDDLFALISDGNLSLMRTVERFDYMRGNKFSTYATWGIMKNYARSIPEERSQLSRYQTGHEQRLDVEPDPEDQVAAVDRRLEGIRGALDEVLNTLPTRERMIVVRHFGLTPDGKRQTLDQIGRLFGVSKERARQLEKRALGKLRETISPSVLEAVLD